RPGSTIHSRRSHDLAQPRRVTRSSRAPGAGCTALDDPRNLPPTRSWSPTGEVTLNLAIVPDASEEDREAEEGDPSTQASTDDACAQASVGAGSRGFSGRRPLPRGA